MLILRFYMRHIRCAKTGPIKVSAWPRPVRLLLDVNWVRKGRGRSERTSVIWQVWQLVLPYLFPNVDRSLSQHIRVSTTQLGLGTPPSSRGAPP